MTKPKMGLRKRPYRWVLYSDYNVDISPRFENLRAAYWWVQGYLSKQLDEVQSND